MIQNFLLYIHKIISYVLRSSQPQTMYHLIKQVAGSQMGSYLMNKLQLIELNKESIKAPRDQTATDSIKPYTRLS